MNDVITTFPKFPLWRTKVFWSATPSLSPWSRDSTSRTKTPSSSRSSAPTELPDFENSRNKWTNKKLKSPLLFCTDGPASGPTGAWVQSLIFLQFIFYIATIAEPKSGFLRDSGLFLAILTIKFVSEICFEVNLRKFKFYVVSEKSIVPS